MNRCKICGTVTRGFVRKLQSGITSMEVCVNCSKDLNENTAFRNQIQKKRSKIVANALK